VIAPCRLASNILLRPVAAAAPAAHSRFHVQVVKIVNFVNFVVSGACISPIAGERCKVEGDVLGSPE